MYPHPNKLPRWLYWTLHGSGLALLLSGLVWLVLHYALGAGFDADRLPHPGEAWALRFHGLLLYPFLLALGGLGTVHIPRGWRERRNVASGLLLIGLGFALIASGYVLYYWTSDDRRMLIGTLHASLGALMALLFFIHRRTMDKGRSGPR